MAAARGVFVDSGAWIALFRAKDSRHREADAAFRSAIAGGVPLITTNLVRAEVHRFVLHRVGIRPAALCLERMASSRSVRVVFATADHDRDARRWIDRFHDQAITYTDAVSFAVMKAERLRAALTFDRDFGIAGYRRWTP